MTTPPKLSLYFEIANAEAYASHFIACREYPTPSIEKDVWNAVRSGFIEGVRHATQTLPAKEEMWEKRVEKAEKERDALAAQCAGMREALNKVLIKVDWNSDDFSNLKQYQETRAIILSALSTPITEWECRMNTLLEIAAYAQSRTCGALAHMADEAPAAWEGK